MGLNAILAGRETAWDGQDHPYSGSDILALSSATAAVDLRDAPPSTHDVMIAATVRALRNSLDVDLCAYLHQPLGESASLVVASSPRGVAAPDGFAFLEAMKAALESDRLERAAHVADYHVVMFSSNGPRSRGLHLIGSESQSLSAPAVDAARGQCRLLAAVVHNLEETW